MPSKRLMATRTIAPGIVVAYITVAFGTVAFGAGAVSAQVTLPRRASVDSVAPTLWSGENDTIDPRLPAATPYTSFERYAFTEECASAAAWTETMVWATRRRDSVVPARYGNPLDPSAVAAGQRCLARFDMPLTTARDMMGLGATYLAVHNDAAAAAAFARAEQDAASLSPERRAWVKAFIIELYLTAAQPRFAAAAAMQNSLDALGAPATIPQMMAHLHMAQAGMRVDSVALWEREANAAIAAIGRATPEMRREYALEGWNGYWLLVRVRLRTNDVPGAKAALERLRNDLVPVLPFLRGRAVLAEGWIGQQGTRAPAIRATRWINGSAPDDTIHPTPGHVSIVMFTAANCGYRCANQYAMIRRLTEQFGASLDVVLMTRTLGYYGERLVAPDSELSLIRHYFVDQVRLPARIAAWKTDVRRREDDAIEPVELPNEAAYPMVRSDDPVAEIVAPDGTWRMLTEFVPSREVLIADVIREELARSAKSFRPTSYRPLTDGRQRR